MLIEYQNKITAWARYNFNNNDPIDYNIPFKGIVEETCYELNEAIFDCCSINNINSIKDSIADITIFLLHLCGERNWSADTILYTAYSSFINSCHKQNKSVIALDNLKFYQYRIHTYINNIDISKIFNIIIKYIGKLSQSLLKQDEHIRGSDDEHELNAQFNAGQILFYLIVLCDQYNIDFENTLTKTWDKVSKRDWIKFPNNGLTE